MRAFAKAVCIGTLAGAWLPLIFTVFIAIATLPAGLNGDGQLWQTFWLAVAPITVTLPIVFGSCLFLGLPSVWLLKRLNAATGPNYVFVGAIGGFFVPIAILLCMQAPDGWWMSILGSFSGAMTASSWARSTHVE
jgi:hypothetical protein